MHKVLTTHYYSFSNFLLSSRFFNTKTMQKFCSNLVVRVDIPSKWNLTKNKSYFAITSWSYGNKPTYLSIIRKIFKNEINQSSLNYNLTITKHGEADGQTHFPKNQANPHNKVKETTIKVDPKFSEAKVKYKKFEVISKKI